MINIKWTYFLACFQFLCWSAVVIMVSYWIYIFTLNEDLCIVDYKNYFQDKSDERPVLSICLKNPISAEKLKIIAPQTDTDTYLGFLNGSNFNTTFLDIDYQKVILTMSDYASEISLTWSNGKEVRTRRTKGLFETTNAFIYHNRFYQCYTLQSPKIRGLLNFVVTMNSSAFPVRTRPQTYEMFLVLHYPSHFLKDIINKRYPLKRDTNDQYIMRFRIDGVEVLKRRNKRSRPCNDWRNFDRSIIEHDIKKAGCRASYQPMVDGIPVCLNKEKTKQASRDRFNDEFEIDPPCKSMEKIYYTYTEGDQSETIYAERNKFRILIYPYNRRFKEILQTRYISIACLSLKNITCHIGHVLLIYIFYF